MIMWRFDRQCGDLYPDLNGGPAECDPEGEFPCCSTMRGECGPRDSGPFDINCKCLGCIDYGEVKKWRDSGFVF